MQENFRTLIYRSICNDDEQQYYPCCARVEARQEILPHFNLISLVRWILHFTACNFQQYLFTGTKWNSRCLRGTMGKIV